MYLFMRFLYFKNWDLITKVFSVLGLEQSFYLVKKYKNNNV